MKDLKMEEVPKFIAHLEEEGESDFAELVKEEYEYAKEALQNISFYELVMIYYVGCLSSDRQNNYLQLARAEAVMHEEINHCVEELKKAQNGGNKND